MNKLTALLLVGFALSSTACAMGAQPDTADDVSTESSALETAAPPVGTTMHDNNVTFITRGTNANTVRFRFDGGYAISSGQPWGGLSMSSSAPTSGLTIDAKAGRHKTDDVAKWFTDRVPHAAGAAGSFDSMPGALNFAFSGDFDLVAEDGTTGTYRIVIGQGSETNGGNNWWIGGQGDGWKQGRAIGGLQQCVETPDGKFTITAQDTDRLVISGGTDECLFAN